MTYLELVRRLALEVGASGNIQTLQGVVGEPMRLATWVQQAWSELQLMRDTWRWRQGEFEVPLPKGAVVIDAAKHVPDFYRLFGSELYVSAGAAWLPLTEVSFTDWQSLVRAFSSTEAAPRMFTWRPDRTIEVWPASAHDTKLRGMYVKKPQVLVNDFDVPLLPEEYHSIIVYKAMMLYAGYESAPEVYQNGVQGFNRMMSLMTLAETPDVSLPPPLE